MRDFMKRTFQKLKKIIFSPWMLLILLCVLLIVDFVYVEIMSGNAEISWYPYNYNDQISSFSYDGVLYQDVWGLWTYKKSEQKNSGMTLIAMAHEVPFWPQRYDSYSEENPDYIIVSWMNSSVYFREDYDPALENLTVLNATDPSKLSSFCLTDLMEKGPIDDNALNSATRLFTVECSLTEHPDIRIQFYVETYDGMYYLAILGNQLTYYSTLSSEYAENLLSAYGID